MLNFIVNPRAMRGKGKSLIHKLETRLKNSGAEYRIFFSQREGGIGMYARSLSQAGQRKFVVVGGDGSLNELLSNLSCPEECSVGIIPAGTGNDFASALKLPKGVKALSKILGAEPKPIDYIECGNGRRSINIAGLGIDADILERRNRARAQGKKKTYFGALLTSLKHYRGLNLEVTVNGETKNYRAFLAAVCNGSTFGGGIKICPVAKPDDGQMELLVVDQPKRSKILIELLSLMRGKILKRAISHRITCTEARIVPEEEQAIQYDGELFPSTALEATLVSGKLKFYRG